jgi:hypothetical protein
MSSNIQNNLFAFGLRNREATPLDTKSDSHDSSTDKNQTSQVGIGNVRVAYQVRHWDLPINPMIHQREDPRNSLVQRVQVQPVNQTVDLRRNVNGSLSLLPNAIEQSEQNRLNSDERSNSQGLLASPECSNLVNFQNLLHQNNLFMRVLRYRDASPLNTNSEFRDASKDNNSSDQMFVGSLLAVYREHQAVIENQQNSLVRRVQGQLVTQNESVRRVMNESFFDHPNAIEQSERNLPDQDDNGNAQGFIPESGSSNLVPLHQILRFPIETTAIEKNIVETSHCLISPSERMFNKILTDDNMDDSDSTSVDDDANNGDKNNVPSPARSPNDHNMDSLHRPNVARKMNRYDPHSFQMTPEAEIPQASQHDALL